VSAEPEIIDVSGVAFKMAKLDGEAGRGLALDVMRLIGPAVAASSSGDIGAMFLSLGSGASRADVDRVVNVLGGVCRVEVGDGKWKFVNVETRKTFFEGRQKLQFAWLGEAIKFQLADFFVERTPA
jgi:hypothetical protein